MGERILIKIYSKFQPRIKRSIEGWICAMCKYDSSIFAIKPMHNFILFKIPRNPTSSGNNFEY